MSMCPSVLGRPASASALLLLADAWVRLWAPGHPQRRNRARLPRVSLCVQALICGLLEGAEGAEQPNGGAWLTTVPSQVGIALHYSTLSSSLWILVTARNIYKQVTRKAPPCSGAERPDAKQPLLRYQALTHVPSHLGSSPTAQGLNP